MDISIQNRFNPPHTTLRRRRADPTGARAIAAKLKNRFPCTACKKSRQKCSGGPPANETCNNCKMRKIPCVSKAPDVTGTDLRIIEESGKSPSVAPRASTSSRDTTSTVDSEASRSTSETLLSPISPFLDSLTQCCESPANYPSIAFPPFDYDPTSLWGNEDVPDSFYAGNEQFEPRQASQVAQMGKSDENFEQTSEYRKLQELTPTWISMYDDQFPAPSNEAVGRGLCALIPTNDLSAPFSETSGSSSYTQRRNEPLLNIDARVSPSASREIIDSSSMSEGQTGNRELKFNTTMADPDVQTTTWNLALEAGLQKDLYPPDRFELLHEFAGYYSYPFDNGILDSEQSIQEGTNEFNYQSGSPWQWDWA